MKFLSRCDLYSKFGEFWGMFRQWKMRQISQINWDKKKVIIWKTVGTSQVETCSGVSLHSLRMFPLRVQSCSSVWSSLGVWLQFPPSDLSSPLIGSLVWGHQLQWLDPSLQLVLVLQLWTYHCFVSVSNQRDWQHQLCVCVCVCVCCQR